MEIKGAHDRVPGAGSVGLSVQMKEPAQQSTKALRKVLFFEEKEPAERQRQEEAAAEEQGSSRQERVQSEGRELTAHGAHPPHKGGHGSDQRTLSRRGRW